MFINIIEIMRNSCEKTLIHRPFLYSLIIVLTLFSGWTEVNTQIFPINSVVLRLDGEEHTNISDKLL